MRRPFVFLVILLCALTGWPAVPSGQGGPSLSGDLLKPGHAGERIRVIVQAHDGTETSGFAAISGAGPARIEGCGRARSVARGA